MKPASLTVESIGARFVALAVVALAFASCYSPPPPAPPVEVVRTDKVNDFEKRSEDLVDLVVLAARPPEGDPRENGPHLRRFRRLVYERLVDKGYSPYRLNYVDQRYGEEPLGVRVDPDHNAKRFDEDALVALSINEFDRRYKNENGILVSATISLIASDSKQKLWMHEIRHRLYKIPFDADERNLTQEDAVIDQVVEDLLATLPPRA